MSAHRLAFLSTQPVRAASPLFARTSGSTGRPLTVRFGPAEWYELNQASYARIARQYPSLTDRSSPGQLSVAMIHDGANRQATDTLLLELNFTVFSRFVLRDEPQSDQNVVRALRSAPLPMLYGKPAYLLKLARLDEALGPRADRIEPGLVFTSGEKLYGDQRVELEARYGCDVINGYTSVEGGLLALQCPQGASLHVDATLTFLEIRTPSGDIRAEGEGELVLTNLWNRAMPFVRYRTGDYGVLRTAACACGHSGQTLVRLDGREVGAFQGPWGSVNTEDLDTAFAGLDLESFQIEQQREDAFALAWVGSQDQAATADVEKQIVGRLRSHLRNGQIDITIRRVPAFTKRGFKIRRYFSRSLGRTADGAVSAAPRDLSAPAQGASILALDASARRLAFTSAGRVVVTDLSTGIESYRTSTRHRSVVCAQLSPTDDLVAFASGRRVFVHSFMGATPVAGFAATERLTSLAFSYDGLILVAGGARGRLHAWTVDASGSATAATGRSALTILATSSISRIVASVARGGIEVRTLPDLELFCRIATSNQVSAMTFMLDDNILCAGSASGLVELWNVDDQSKVATLQHAASITVIGFSQSMQTIVAGDANGGVQLWDVWRGRPKGRFRAHQSAVQAIAAFPDGDGFATVARDGTVRAWPWTTGSQ